MSFLIKWEFGSLDIRVFFFNFVVVIELVMIMGIRSFLVFCILYFFRIYKDLKMRNIGRREILSCR